MSKCVLLYTGGLDSYCTYALIHKGELKVLDCTDMELYHLNLKTTASEKEEGVILEQFVSTMIEGKVAASELLDLTMHEQENHIIPMRNLFLVAKAMFRAPTVLLAATAGDITPDTDLAFATLSTNLFKHLWKDSDKFGGEKREFARVILPVKNFTKTQLVKRYLRAGLSPDNLLKTYSCYKGTRLECGACKACFRKWIALKSNGLEGQFECDPIIYADEHLNQFLSMGRRNEYDEAIELLKQIQD